MDRTTQDGFNFAMSESFDEYGNKPVRSRFIATIIRLEDCTPVGSIFLSDTDTPPDLAIMIYPSFRGMGYGTRAFRMGVKYCFDTLCLGYVTAGCYENNTASRKMIEACGFVPQPSDDTHEKHYLTGQDTIQYGYIRFNSVIDESLQSAIHTMTAEITAVLADLTPTIYLYGSVTLGDFRLGWSDIDILVLTNGEITQEQADKLVGLRQMLLEREPGNAYYRSFEGGMLDLTAFLNGGKTHTVYWGTSGQRITDSHVFDSFSMVELLGSGILLHGEDVRGRMTSPTYGELRGDVMRHYETIRKYAQTTNRSIQSYGWLLDIARGIYTLQTGKVISKTAAGEWALKNNLCPNTEVMQTALMVRKNPLTYNNNAEILEKSALLGEEIQGFADVLEREFQSTVVMFARDELNIMGVKYTDLAPMQYKDGVALWRVKTANRSAVLKCFDKHEYRREIENYRILRELDIPTLKVYAQTACSLLMEDIESGDWRLGVESDLHDPKIATLVARWYRVLHERGREYAENHALYDECNCLTLDNIAHIKAKTNTEDAPAWAIIESDFEQIRTTALSLPRTLTYNDFYYTNLAVRKDGTAALMFDYNLLGKSYIYSDIRNVCSSLGDEAKAAFLAEYGEFDRREIAIDDVVCPIITLIAACEQKAFPQWASGSLADVKNGMLLAAVERLLEGEN
jgi:RimJ/RimL family protein N-acetyltransferase/predicted nucleotidyltransferase